MFYFLHRLVKVCFVLLLLLGLYWAWRQRAVLEPVYVWYDVYENGGLGRTNALPVMHGEYVQVIDGHTFQLRSDDKIYSVRLTGFDLPEPPIYGAELELERERRRVLREMLDGKPVQVELTYSNMHSLLGLVQVPGTNLNTYFITNRLSHFNPSYVKSLPRSEQFEFFAAARLLEKETGKETTLALKQ